MTIFSSFENASAGMLASTVENHIVTALQVISSVGSQAYTVGGTVAAGIYQFQLSLTRASDGRIIQYDGNFTYQNAPVPSTADFTSKFAIYLSMYFDIRATASASTLTITSPIKGYTPDLLLRTGTVTLTAGARVNAPAPAPFAYGDVVEVSKSVNGDVIANLPVGSALTRPMLGIVVNDGYNAIDPTEYKAANNRTWGVLLRGDIWVRQAGITPVNARDLGIGLVGTRLVGGQSLAGKFLGDSGWDVAGTLPLVGRWGYDTNAATAPYRFSTIDNGTPAGQLFRVTLG